MSTERYWLGQGCPRRDTGWDGVVLGEILAGTGLSPERYWLGQGCLRRGTGWDRVVSGEVLAGTASVVRRDTGLDRVVSREVLVGIECLRRPRSQGVGMSDTTSPGNSIDRNTEKPKPKKLKKFSLSIVVIVLFVLWCVFNFNQRLKVAKTW